MVDTAQFPQFSDIVCDVAYFCMEFGLDQQFNIYSGGLGILAADYVYEADQRKAPIVAVGLLYATGYHQTLNQDGYQEEQANTLQPEQERLQLITNAYGKPLEIEVPIQDRFVIVRGWVKTIGNIPLILLDTKHSANISQDQYITDQLYAGDKEHRLQQEMILGIGGMQFLQALEISPKKYHMNEGHAAFLIFEHIAQLMKTHHLNFEEAQIAARNDYVFTNHTLITAGNDAFDIEIFTHHFRQYAERLRIPVHTLLEMGRVENTNLFSMTIFALRYAGKSAAVSEFHAQKAKDLWPEYPLIPITNGIYGHRWIAGEKALVWPLRNSQQPTVDSWWTTHQHCKDQLLSFIHKTTGKQLASNTLIITWARRFVDYKRPKALFWQLDWLHQIITSSHIPVHFIFAGKVHPHDFSGKQMISEVVQIAQSDRFKDHVTFIPDYSIDVASRLVQGSDVWLNTPMEGFEACGTSGMKAALNGVLQCTTNDGWVREVKWNDIGWILEDDRISESLYHTIEKEILPLYTQRNEHDLPVQWVQRMIASSQLIRNRYTTKRMMDEYFEKLYS